MTSKDIKKCRFDIKYKGKNSNIGMGVMSYLYYITIDPKDYVAESVINREIREWYPIKNTSLLIWHACKMALVRMGILEDVIAYCPDPEYKGAIILNDDFRAIRRENINEFKQFEKYFNVIKANFLR